MGYFRAKMKELWSNEMIEVSIEKLKGDLLDWKMERMKGEPMVQKKVQTMALSYN